MIPILANLAARLHRAAGGGGVDGPRRSAPRALLLTIAAGAVLAVVGEARAVEPDSTAAPSDSSATVEQRDIMDVLNRVIRGKRIEPEMNVQFGQGIAWTILPSATYNPVYGLAIGASASGAGRRGDDPSSRISSLSIGGNYSTTGQVQAYVKGDVFSGSGAYLMKGDVRYMDTQRSTWGLGPMIEDQSEYPMDFKQARVYATLYRRVGGSVYTGLGYHFDEFYDILDERAEAGEATPFTLYSKGAVEKTIASGASVNLLGDTRDNPVNPSRGYFLSASLRSYSANLGSDANWQEMWAEFRAYPHFPVRSRNTLGFWLYSWFSFGSPPYLDLPAIGGDTHGRGGRGYLQGRIRGRNQLYFETEYRMQLTHDGLLGAVAFLNLTGTTLPDEQTFGRTDKGGGIGLRVKLNKRSNTNLSIDAAWGENSGVKWFFGATEVF